MVRRTYRGVHTPPLAMARQNFSGNRLPVSTFLSGSPSMLSTDGVGLAEANDGAGGSDSTPQRIAWFRSRIYSAGLAHKFPASSVGESTRAIDSDASADGFGAENLAG